MKHLNDSLTYRIVRGKWKSTPWGAKVQLHVGDTLCVVSRRHGLLSDTLTWEAPAYLRHGFAQGKLGK